VIEALSKTIIFFLLLLSIPFLDDIDYKSENFIFSNIAPLELSKIGFGFKIIDIADKKDIYLTYYSWISDNLFIDGFFSPTTQNTIEVTYGMNLGYSTKFNNDYFRSINYSIGYFSKKFVNMKQKWSNLSIIPMFKIHESWLILVFNYSFDDNNEYENSKNSLIFNYSSPITKSIILNSGVQAFENNNSIMSAFFIGLSYKL
jgi:hypothetical protein